MTGPVFADRLATQAKQKREADMMATMADAHREWHWNTGIPMGTPGCPQDACHPIEDWADEPGIKCGHCKQYHYTTREVLHCDVRLANIAHVEKM